MNKKVDLEPLGLNKGIFNVNVHFYYTKKVHFHPKKRGLNLIHISRICLSFHHTKLYLKTLKITELTINMLKMMSSR